MQVTNTILESMLTALKTGLDGGFCYVFAGAMPSTAGEALNLATTHTEMAKLSLGGDGVTGLTFSAATGGVLAKPGAADWHGLVAFSGFEAALTTLTPTFFRFCPAGDDGRGAGSGARLQGSVGGPASADEMKLEADTLTRNGTNTAIAASFNARLTPVA